MASVSVKLRQSSVPDRAGKIYFQVFHNGTTCQVRTPYKLFSQEWDVRQQTVVLSTDHPSERFHYLKSIRKALEIDLERFELIIISLYQSQRNYTAADIAKRFWQHEEANDFLSFIVRTIEQKRTAGKSSLAAKYQTTLNSLQRFLSNRTLTFEGLNRTLLQEYESWMLEQSLCRNTTSFYMRNLRALYNQAVDQGLCEQTHPFKGVYTGIDKTTKRALTASEVQQLKEQPLPAKSAEEFARDLFLFSIYTRGMSFIDIAHLQKSNLQHGYLVYARKKTGDPLKIRWMSCMQELVDKYSRPHSDYLFPILQPTDDESKRRLHYANCLHRVNRKLKQMGRAFGFQFPMTTYVARHSWASIAKNEHVHIATISEAMGHHSETTTAIYLSELNSSVVDQANDVVLKAIGC